MRRSILTLSFASFAVLASAQERQVKVVDTPQMKAKAEERTELVHRTVNLTEAQRAQVLDAYLEVERYRDALRQRFEGQPAEVVEGDMPGQYKVMDEMVETRLNAVLTEEQLKVWHEAAR